MIICSPIVYNIIILIAQLSAIAIIDNLITIILSYFKRIDINIWKNQSKITMITTINKISNYKNKTESIYIKALILFVIIITPFINILLSNLIIPQVIIQDVKNSNITMNIDVSKILCSGNFKNSTIENIKKCLKNNVCNNINNCTLNEKVDGINIIFSNDTYDHISLKPKNINNFSKIGDTNMTNIDILYNAGNFTYIDFYNPGIRETTNINTLKQDWDDDDEKNPWYYNSELIPSTGSDAFLSSINFYNSYSAEKYINLINIFNKTHIVLSTSLTYLYHYEGLGKDKNYPINNITSIIDDADVTNIFNEILNKTYYNSAMLNNYIYMGEVIKYDNNTVIQYQLLSQNTGRDSYGMSIIYLTIRKHNYYLRKSPVIGKDYKLSNRLIDCNKIGICDNGLRSAMNRIAIYSNKLTVPYSSYGDVVKNNFILDLSSEGFLDNVKVEDLIEISNIFGIMDDNSQPTFNINTISTKYLTGIKKELIYITIVLFIISILTIYFNYKFTDIYYTHPFWKIISININKDFKKTFIKIDSKRNIIMNNYIIKNNIEEIEENLISQNNKKF